MITTVVVLSLLISKTFLILIDTIISNNSTDLITTAMYIAETDTLMSYIIQPFEFTEP